MQIHSNYSLKQIFWDYDKKIGYGFFVFLFLILAAITHSLSEFQYPYLIPIAVLVISTIPAMIKFPQLWIYSVTFFSLFFFSNSEEGVSAMDILAAGYLLGTLILWFIYQLVKGEKIIENKTDWLFFFFFIVLAFNSIIALDNDVKFIDWARQYGLMTVALYAFPVRRYIKTKEQINIVLLIFMLVIFITALFQLYEYYKAITSDDVLYVYQLATMVRRNQTLYTTTIAFSIIFFFFQKNLFKQLIFILFTGLTFAGLVTSFSRTFWVLVLVNTVIIGFLVTTKDRIKLVAILVFSAGIFLSITYLYFEDRFETMVEVIEKRLSSSSKGTKDVSFQARSREWDAVEDKIWKYPLGGNGFNKPFVYQDPLTGYSKNNVVIHNGYYWLAYFIGIPLTIVYVLIMLIYFGKLSIYSFKLKDKYYRYLAIASALGLFVLLLSDFLAAQFILRDGLYVTAFCYGFAYMCKNQLDNEQKQLENEV